MKLRFLLPGRLRRFNLGLLLPWLLYNRHRYALSLWSGQRLWISMIALVLPVVSCLLWGIPLYAQEDEVESSVQVITHRGVEMNAITQASLRAIFGMRNRHWSDGELIQVFVLPDDDPTHIAFTKHLLRTFPYHLRSIWDRRVYSGTGPSPTRVKSEEEMRRRVAVSDHAIGYLGGEWVTDTVKVLELK